MLEVTNQLKHLAQRWGLQFNSIAKIEDEVVFLYTRKVQGEILAAPSIRKNEPGQRIARGASLSSSLSGWHYKGLILLTSSVYGEGGRKQLPARIVLNPHAITENAVRESQ